MQKSAFAHEARLPGLVEYTNMQMFFIAMIANVGGGMLGLKAFLSQNMCNPARTNTHEQVIVNGNTGHRYESRVFNCSVLLF
jgi:hypothetical protein